MTPRSQRAARRRREMLQAYYETLVAEGVKGPSLAKIAGRLGIHDSLLVRYFGTKDQMTLELIDYMFEDLMRTYGEGAEHISDPREKLLAMVKGVFTPEYQLMVDGRVWYAAFYQALGDERVRDKFRASWGEAHAIWVEALQDCVDAGAIRAGDPEELATLIRAAEEGFAEFCAVASSEQQHAIGRTLERQILSLLGLDG